jgi:large subunit ribosomal protein L21
MYAIIEDGGRQFRVAEGQEIEIDLRDLPAGETAITFDRVLAVRTDEEFRVGQPLLAGASVSAELIGTLLGDKLTVQKFRRRKTFRKRTGHRQIFSRVRIGKIAV